MLRAKGFVAALAAGMLLVVAGASGAARQAAPAADLYLGEWTADATSNAATTGHPFTLASSDESTARALTGNFGGAFDDYCKSSYPGVQPVTYFTVTTTWNSATELGGCQSGKTGGHVYAWSSTQIWYAHYGVSNGEPKLTGVWEPTGNRNVSDKFTADHPAARFLTNVKYAVVGKKGGRAAELITATGTGLLAVASKPGNCLKTNVLGGFGAVTVKVVKVGGPKVVEIDDVTVKLVPSGGQYEGCDSQDLLFAIPVTVKSADPSEENGCPVGSTGTLYLGDRTSKQGADSFGLEVGKCHLAVTAKQAKARKGSHVAVAVTFDENGY